ncbi:unnamed protein product [Allacma fusca]|uniref:Lipase domain-containing protein n=1 Tax=Allacma fusca TaxID=39272 RepID=A0A8J2PXR6_9HEXA|nr:unnamed protein product [Allacma fusca]
MNSQIRWCFVLFFVTSAWNVLAVNLANETIQSIRTPMTEEASNKQNKLFFLSNDFHARTNKSSAIFTLHTLNCQYGEKIIIEKSIINKTCFNASNDLKILIHGYTEKGHSVNSMVPIRLDHAVAIGKGNSISYFRAKRNINVLMVDWSIHAVDGNYINAVRHLNEVANYIAMFLVFMQQTTTFQNMTRVHIVGFSLGAHVAGLVGRRINSLTGHKIGRITGLDPAGPGFHTILANDRIRLNDANFMDFIHGDTDTFGGNFQGHANFYPNGGKKQPGCRSFLGVLIGCGHRRAPQWYSESVMFPKRYVGCRCTDFQSFNDNKCSCVNRNDLAVLGEHCSTKTRGVFFLHVKDADYQYVIGIYPNLISFGFNNRGIISNHTVPSIPLEEVLPTIPSFNFTAIDVPPPKEEE